MIITEPGEYRFIKEYTHVQGFYTIKYKKNEIVEILSVLPLAKRVKIDSITWVYNDLPVEKVEE